MKKSKVFPAKSRKVRTRVPCSSSDDVSEPPSSRRKAGAEAVVRPSPIVSLPRSSSFRLATSGGRAIPGKFSISALRDQLSITISALREVWRDRQNWHRAEKSLTLQCKAICRRLTDGDKKKAEKLYKAASATKGTGDVLTAFLSMEPLLSAQAAIKASRLEAEKRLLYHVGGMPVLGFVDATRGFGRLSLAGIVGEVGDIGSYRSPAALWKRMGLAVINGKRQRKVADKDEALLHGYSPKRRSLMWTIGDCIIKAGGPLREVYDKKKAEYLTREWTKAHAHNAAKRYIEKRLLKMLWQAWRRATYLSSPMDLVPSSNLIGMADTKKGVISAVHIAA